MTIIIKDCKECGTRNVVNENKIAEINDQQHIFGKHGYVVKDNVEVVESDQPRCKKCGEIL